MKQIKEKPADVYRFLKQFELTSSVAFRKVCDSNAANQLVRFAERILYPDTHPSEVRLRLSKRWRVMKRRKRGDYESI